MKIIYLTSLFYIFHFEKIIFLSLLVNKFLKFNHIYSDYDLL